MFSTGISRRLVLSAAGLIILLSGSVLVAQKEKQSHKDKQAMPDAPAVLWREPSDIASRDLYLGPGGEEMKPDLTNVTFLKEDATGYSVKWRVRDGAGRTWVAKLGNEARPETAAVRLVWAAGYATEINYLAPCAHIKGAPKPRKDIERCEGDGFTDVRFEARPDDVKRLDIWAWKENPFANTRELKGLVILMAVLNNWDLKDENNKILAVTRPDGTTELQYVISDLGATFGKTGGPISHSRNEPEKFVKTKFLERVDQGHIRLAYDGKQGGLLKDITVEEARWIGSLLAQLSDQQLEDAFRAADFKPEEIRMLTQAVRLRIDTLANLGG